MKIEVLCSINSGTYKKGDIIEVENSIAKRLIKLGAAVKPTPKQKKRGSKKHGNRKV